MINLTKLKVILNEVPSSIREEGSDLELLSHALRAYRAG